jgi:DNA-binding MarR family transcriptional regulator
MDYSSLTDELLKKLVAMKRSHSHKKLGEFVEGEMFVLNVLTFGKDKALPGELAALMKTSTSRIAAILNGLERKGLITREIDEADRRRILVALTAAGKELVLEKHQRIYDFTKSVLERLGEDDAREALRLLDRVIDVYKELAPSSCNPCAESSDADTNNLGKGEPNS